MSVLAQVLQSFNNEQISESRVSALAAKKCSVQLRSTNVNLPSTILFLSSRLECVHWMLHLGCGELMDGLLNQALIHCTPKNKPFTIPIVYILIDLHNKNTFPTLLKYFLVPLFNHTGSGRFHKLCVIAFNDIIFYKFHYNYYIFSQHDAFSLHYSDTVMTMVCTEKLNIFTSRYTVNW